MARRGDSANEFGCAAVAIVIALLVFAPVAVAADRDKDGLPDKWEKGKTPQGLNLHKLHANPKHKDVFVELNYSRKVSAGNVSCGALDQLVAAYRKAPVTNPDHKGGIALHIDAGRKCGKSKRYDLGGSSRFKVKAGSGCASFLDTANTLSRNRLNVFHAGGVVADSELCTAEGQEGGGDFLVKIRDGGEGFAYVVMHELGHAFGLDHGPFNGFSVMSGGAYRFSDSSQQITYTDYPIEPLDETDLDEHTGWSTGSAKGDAWLSKFYAPQFCTWSGQTTPSMLLDGRATGPVDWDCDGAPFYLPPYSQYIDSGHVAYDVNGDGTIGTVPGVPASWPTVVKHLGSGRIGNRAP